MSRLLNEPAVLGILTNYASTIVNYALAIAYLIVLTKFIPLTQYGYYNAIVALLSIVSLFFPTFGIDNAVAREAAMAHASGRGVDGYYSALFALTFTLTMGYVVASMALIPVFIRDGVPSWLMGIIYINAVSALISMLVGVMGFYLWATGRVVSQGVGSTLGSLTYRVGEVALVLILRNVYAIALSVLLNNIVTLAYYLSRVRVLPRLKLGYSVLKARVKAFLNSGFQFWLAYYINSMYGSILAYLVFKTIGPTYSGLYGLSITALGSVTGFSGAVGSVFGSMASRGLAMGVDLNTMTRDYAKSMTVITAVLSLAAVALLPLAPIIHIFNGEYVKAIPYLALLIGTAPVSTIDTVYMMYYWVNGKGWLAVERSLVGALVMIAVFMLLVKELGLYAAVAASYAGTVAIVVLYWLNNRPWGLGFGLVASLSVLMPTVSALPIALYDPLLPWPLFQLTLLALFTIIMLLIKPVSISIINDTPRILRPLLKPFTRRN
ncbi:polysaccharide biosynthesis protein [Caldivirga maquilingensis]|uniref:Polysaccharide biosynthesis protein n=1 Tax=Caldivirga maquilingensis (strain ATCC 700844 / DSM 13496 / JCM 10307 / IC-167) TaxID=397948 RepID=A8M981_CALMQ|nr:polysaccharide biosynthesis protein [Caldivirga maquilingensis]ABW02300.1 polysaccharide biosynthesis protein [Caldivirga maquilingensis IC-167]